MKKSWKIYLWSWAAYIAIIIFGFILATTQNGTEHHNHLIKLSESPEYIEEIVKVDLPDIAHVESDIGNGNYWTTYGYELKFSEELSEDCIRELNMRYKTDNAHWSTNSGAFIYRESASSNYELSCLIYKDHSVVEYGFTDELPTSFLVFLASTTIVFYILIAWGVIHLIISFIRKVRNK